MKSKKRQLFLEHTISFLSWFVGLITALVIAYALWIGSIEIPEILGGHLFSEIVAWVLGISATLTVLLSFFRK